MKTETPAAIFRTTLYGERDVGIEVNGGFVGDTYGCVVGTTVVMTGTFVGARVNGFEVGLLDTNLVGAIEGVGNGFTVGDDVDEVPALAQPQVPLLGTKPQLQQHPQPVDTIHPGVCG